MHLSRVALVLTVVASSAWASLGEQKPFEREGRCMNGYLIVEKARSWETLSRYVYGVKDAAPLMKSWNKGGELTSGRVVYFNSPQRPDDCERLLTKNQEKASNVAAAPDAAPTQVVSRLWHVRAGDTLGKLAREHLGKSARWREIVQVNKQLQNPHRLEIGQIIQIPLREQPMVAREPAKEGEADPLEPAPSPDDFVSKLIDERRNFLVKTGILETGPLLSIQESYQ